MKRLALPSTALVLVLWVLAPVDLSYYAWPVADAWAGVDGAGGVPPDGSASVPATPAAIAAEDAGAVGAPPAASAAPVSDPVPAAHGDSVNRTAAAGTASPPLDLPALAATLASVLVATGAGAATHALSRRRKGRAAKALRAATPWAKLLAGIVVGAAATSMLAGAALPAALAYGIAAGVSAIAGRQLVVKPIAIARET